MPETISRYFSQHPEDVARRHRAFMQAIEPMQRELVRLMSVFPPARVLYMPAGRPMEDMSPPWEEGLPPEVRQYVENVRGHIQRTAAEYGFNVDVPAL